MWSALTAIGIHTMANRCWTWAATTARNLHKSVFLRRTVPDSIICSVHSLVYRNRSWPLNIIRIFCTLVRQYWMLPANIIHSLHTLVGWCQPTTSYIFQACIQTWCVGIWQATSAKTYKHKRGLCISQKWHRSMACKINQGLQARTCHVSM